MLANRPSAVVSKHCFDITVALAYHSGMSKVQTHPPVKVTTLRLPRPLHKRLELLQVVLQKPLNKLVNEAVDDYVERRTAEVELDLDRTLQHIKAARKKDPQFKRAVAEFVTAEARYAKKDPVEGVVVRPAGAGPTQTLVRSMLTRA